MKNKVLVGMALGAAFAPAVFAQSDGIEIYGRFYPQFGSFKSSGATAAGAVPSNLVTSTGGDHARRNSIDATNSRIGFRGREALGAGLSAIWQIETRVRVDNPSANDAWAGRDSFVGLRGNFGTLRLGNFRSIYRVYGPVVGTFDINPGNFVSTSAVLSGVGLDTNDTGFHVRKQNSVQYETPEFGGFQVGLHYSPDETKGNPGNTLNATLWAFAVRYRMKQLYASVQHERHRDFFDGSLNVAGSVANRDEDLVPTIPGTDPRSRDKATRLSVEYQITRQHSVAADLARLEFTESGQGAAGRFESYKKVTWDIGWEARWGGPWRTSLSYARADDGDCRLSGGVACSTDGLESSQVNLGLAYDFSKRTYVFAIYSRLNNGPSARFDNWTNGTPSRGADTTQAALGIRHAF